ncbi:MAG TPA: NAD-dependent epimerase/dehydratase family protein [Burkholderiales bacterium]|nr:NAD-dependent epimerase/dehydratase family protein [Burkholderiales bacterium]
MKRLLIAGFGDVARRLVAQLPDRTEVRPLSRRSGFDLDRPETLAGIEGWADALLHCAPPPGTGDGDPRSANLLAILERGILPGRFVYVSTSGVYGDCGGALVDEARAPNPQSPRARRRIDAERRLQDWCARRDVALVVLRAPGIYAADRLPLERLRSGMPVLRDEDDIYTNHVHADDLAAAALRALAEDAPAGIYNASDDTHLRMGQWLDLVADRAGLPRPPRIARRGAESRIPAALLSFMCESRRLDNRRLKETLGVRLRYATVYDGLAGVKVPA